MGPSCCCTPEMFISAIRWSLQSPEDTPGPAIVAALLRPLPAKTLSYNIAVYRLYIFSLVGQHYVDSFYFHSYYPLVSRIYIANANIVPTLNCAVLYRLILALYTHFGPSPLSDFFPTTTASRLVPLPLPIIAKY